MKATADDLFDICLRCKVEFIPCGALTRCPRCVQDLLHAKQARQEEKEALEWERHRAERETKEVHRLARMVSRQLPGCKVSVRRPDDFESVGDFWVFDFFYKSETVSVDWAFDRGFAVYAFNDHGEHCDMTTRSMKTAACRAIELLDAAMHEAWDT